MSESDDDAPRPPKRFEEVVKGDVASRTAAHEAGHILVAWLSWAVASVDGTVFRGDRVTVERTLKQPRHPIQLWEGLVILSGGMAGEVVTHATFHTRNCRIDLEGMLMQVEELTKCLGASIRPPWPEPGNHGAIPFEKFFDGGLEDGWGDLMRSAYRRAKDLILLHRDAFERLRTAMLVKIELTTAEIETAIRMKKA